MEENGNYELLFIVHPDLESSIDKSVERIRTQLEKRGGKVIYEENWGKRKLAYEIKKADVGIYVLWFVTAPKSKVAAIEKDFRINEEILRFMLLKSEVKKEAKPKVKKETKEEPKAKAVKKEEPKESKESEKERMKKIDEKLEALLKDTETK